MAKENKPQFKNIVLQDEDGTVHVFEPGAKGLNVILLVLQEEENNMAHVRIRSHCDLQAGATLIHDFIGNTPNLGPALMAVAMGELIEQVRTSDEPKGGPPNETLQ